MRSGGNQGDSRPAAYLNYILFNKDFKVLDAGWQLAPAVTFTKQKLSFPTKTIQEAGYIYVWLSYDDDSNNWVYFDDFKVTHTPSAVIQSNEYYPFGLQTSNSWTRENTTGNNFLYNQGSELNTNTGWYDTPYRGYDATLGRFMQVDPLASSQVMFNVYHYAYNNPVGFNDPMGLMGGPGTPLRSGYSSGADVAPSMGSGGIPYGRGQGSWADQYRSVEMNFALMSSGDFESFYGIDLNSDQGKSWVTNQISSTYYYVTTDEGNYIYTDKSFQDLTGWYRAQAFAQQGDPQTQNGSNGNLILSFIDNSQSEAFKEFNWTNARVNSIMEAYAAVLKYPGEIKNLIIFSHATSSTNTLHLGNDALTLGDFINQTRNAANFQNILGQVSNGGNVIIIGCGAGGPLGFAINSDGINLYMNGDQSHGGLYYNTSGDLQPYFNMNVPLSQPSVEGWMNFSTNQGYSNMIIYSNGGIAPQN